jgi:GNAT superfamily N-acetyltransferase
MHAPVLRWIAYDSPERAALVELRREVLRRPLGLDFTAEQLAAEADQLHLGAWDGARLVGGLLLAPRGAGVAQMRQVAVAQDAQGRGVGRLLVEESEREARRRGFARMVLHARQTAVPFYERLGYAVEGKPYTEIGLPHRTMAKALGPATTTRSVSRRGRRRA